MKWLMKSVNYTYQSLHVCVWGGCVYVCMFLYLSVYVTVSLPVHLNSKAKIWLTDCRIKQFIVIYKHISTVSMYFVVSVGATVMFIFCRSDNRHLSQVITGAAATDYSIKIIKWYMRISTLKHVNIQNEERI